MKKVIVLISLVLFGFLNFAQSPGDSLTILYKHVYLYKNPDQLSSRLDSKGVSYFNKEKLYFIGVDGKFPSYYEVVTSSNDTAYVKAKLVSYDQSLNHSIIQEEVRLGKRKSDINDIANVNDYLPTWAILLTLAALFYLMYLYIRHYRRFDFWFIRMARSKSKPVMHPWFILLPLIFGFVFGSVQLFSSDEAQWYFMDGWQIYGTYPNYWGWLMWSCTIASALILIISLIISFIRFRALFAIIYSVILMLSIAFVFLFGAFTGGLAVIVFIAYIAIKYGKKGESDDNSSSGEYARVDGRLYKRTGPSTWERTAF